MENLLVNLLKGNIGGFRKAIESRIAEKVIEKLHEVKAEIASNIFSEERLDELSKETLTAYTKKASKDLADKERNFYNPKEDNFQNIVDKSDKIARRIKGIENAQNKLEAGDYDKEKVTKVTMKAHYKPKEKPSKVSKEAMKELKPNNQKN